MIEFDDKFIPKKTTDECYTPTVIYEIVKDYVLNNWEDLKDYTIERPFYPGGDYQKDAEKYNDKTVVIDNPPFSILSKIIDFYIEHNIKFFLFAPGLVGLSYADRDITILTVSKELHYVNYYEKKNRVFTCFFTNLDSPYKIIWAQELEDKLKETRPHKRVTKVKNTHPNRVLKPQRDPHFYTLMDFIREKKSVKKVDVIEKVRQNSKGEYYFGYALHIKE